MLAASLATAAVLAATVPKPIPLDFEATVRVERSGLFYQGWMQSDATGRRYAEFLDGMEQLTVKLQPAGRSFVYSYVTIATRPNPTCTCLKQMDTSLDNPWFIYMNTRASANATCSGPKSGKNGTLFELDNLGYVNSKDEIKLCQAADGTPIFISHDQEVREFLTFEPKRVVDFNMTILTQFLPECSSACN